MGLNLIGKIELDGAGFERGLHRATESVTEFVKSATIAAFGFYGVEEAIHKTVETASELVDTSKRLSLTVEQLQLIRQAARSSGTDLETVASALEKIDVARGKIQRGDEEGKKLLRDFERLGVTERMLQTRTAASLLLGPIAGTVKGENPSNIAVQLREILGKGFGPIVPMLQTDMEELESKMRSLGSIMDTETAVKLHALGDNFILLKNVLAAQLGPALITLVEVILTLIGKVKSTGAYLGSLSAHGVSKGGAAMVDDHPLLALTPIGGLFFMLSNFFKRKELKSIAAEANEAAGDANKEWQETLAKMRKQLEEEANKLNNPKPIVEKGKNSDAKKSRIKVPEDALVKVGNFLGANGVTLERANQQKITLLRQIANNTAHASFGMRPASGARPPDRGFDIFGGIQIPQA